MKSRGITTRLWFALMGVNRELEVSMDQARHRVRKAWWDWVSKQSKGFQVTMFALRSLSQALGEVAWDAKDGMHIGARIGWFEGGHRHRERRELRELGKDHADYQSTLERIKADREARQLEYALYSTKHRKDSRKGLKPPKVRDSVTIPAAASPTKPPVAPKPQAPPKYPGRPTGTGDWTVTVVGDRLRTTFPNLTEEYAAQLAAWYEARIKAGGGAATVTLAQSTSDLDAPKGSEESNTNGGTSVTTPTQTAGGDVTSIADMRRTYEATSSTVSSIHDQIAAAAQQARDAATNFENAAASLSAEGHDSQTVAEAHASMEALNAMADQLEQLIATADSATATLEAGRQGLERHRNMEEAVASHPGAANRTAAYRPS